MYTSSLQLYEYCFIYLTKQEWIDLYYFVYKHPEYDNPLI